MKTTLYILAAFYLALIFIGLFLSDYLIFIPPRPGYVNSSPYLQLTAADGRTVAAIYLPNNKANFTLLVSHGNAEDIGYMLPLLKKMQEHGFAVLAYDYPGYGYSEGKPSEQGAYVAAAAAYNYLTKQLKVPPKKIIAYGASLGAAVSLNLAARHQVGALILQSPFLTAFRTKTQIPILPFDKFDNLAKITKVTVPVLIMHGTADEIVPYWQGVKLYKLAPVAKEFYAVENAGHNDLIYVAGDKYWRVIKEFTHKIMSKKFQR